MPLLRKRRGLVGAASCRDRAINLFSATPIQAPYWAATKAPYWAAPKAPYFATFGHHLQARNRAESGRCSGTFSVSCDLIHVIQFRTRIYVEDTAETLQALILLGFDSGICKK